MSFGLEYFKRLRYSYKKWNSVLTCKKYNNFSQEFEIIEKATVGRTEIQYPEGVLKCLNFYIKSYDCPFHERCLTHELRKTIGDELIDTEHQQQYILDIRII